MKLTKEVENFIKEYDIELIEFKSKKLKAKFLCKKCGRIYEKSLGIHNNVSPCFKCRPKNWVNPRIKISAKGREAARQKVLGEGLKEAEIVAVRLNLNIISFGGKTGISKLKCTVCGKKFEASYWLSRKLSPCPNCLPREKRNDYNIKSYNFWINKVAERGVVFNPVDSSKLGAEALIEIYCDKHGWFKKKLKHAASKHICNKCARDITDGSQRRSKDEWVKKMQEKATSGNFEFKILEKWKGITYTKVEAYCPKHNHRWITSPAGFVRGSFGCEKCYRETRKSSTGDFISKAKKIHGELYDYSKVDYKGATTKVVITCPYHGDFLQSPNHHLCGWGCSECANRIRNVKGFNGWVNYYKEFPNLNANLYFIKVSFNGRLYIKIGITKNDVVSRFSKTDLKIEEIYSVINGVGYDISRKEAYLHSILEDFKPKLEKKFDGFSEVYDYSNYDIIKENFDYIGSLPTQELNKLVEGFDFDFWKGHKIK